MDHRSRELLPDPDIASIESQNVTGEIIPNNGTNEPDGDDEVQIYMPTKVLVKFVKFLIIYSKNRNQLIAPMNWSLLSPPLKLAKMMHQLRVFR